MINRLGGCRQLASAFFAAVGLTLGVAPAGVVAADKAEDKTGEVFPGLAELMLARDEVAKRFAFVAVGEDHLVGADGVPDVTPFHFLRAVERKSGFDYAATGRIRHMVQNWEEKVRCGGKYQVAKGLINNPLRYVEKPKGITRVLVGHCLQHEDQGIHRECEAGRLVVAGENTYGERRRHHRHLFWSLAARGHGIELGPAGEDFFLIFRLYGPSRQVVEQKWTLNDVEKIK